MRLGKPTRLEREIHKRIIQQKDREWMAERGYRCPACGWAMAACVCVGHASGPGSEAGGLESPLQEGAAGLRAAGPPASHLGPDSDSPHNHEEQGTQDVA